VSARGAAPGAAAARPLAYGQLLEACAQPGCPVCRCLRAAGVRHLRTLLAEHVTDPATRGRLEASWGFCATHAVAVAELPETGLGVAIVYQGLLARALGCLAEASPDAAEPGGRGWRGLLGRRARPRRRAPARRCPVCADLPAAEARYVDALVTGLARPELAAALARSGGVCLPHLRIALAGRAGRPDAAPLVALARDTLRRLADELGRFIDKHDHRARARITEREAQACRDALALVAGAPELFGTHRPAAPELPGE
jgi:hypothetical protein